MGYRVQLKKLGIYDKMGYYPDNPLGVAYYLRDIGYTELYDIDGHQQTNEFLFDEDREVNSEKCYVDLSGLFTDYCASDSQKQTILDRNTYDKDGVKTPYFQDEDSQSFAGMLKGFSYDDGVASCEAYLKVNGAFKIPDILNVSGSGKDVSHIALPGTRPHFSRKLFEFNEAGVYVLARTASNLWTPDNTSYSLDDLKDLDGYIPLRVIAICQGAGGGGGASGLTKNGGGGGAGGCFLGILNLAPNKSTTKGVSITIGKGGNGGTPGSDKDTPRGKHGGDSSITINSDTKMIAKGGDGATRSIDVPQNGPWAAMGRGTENVPDVGNISNIWVTIEKQIWGGNGGGYDTGTNLNRAGQPANLFPIEGPDRGSYYYNNYPGTAEFTYITRSDDHRYIKLMYNGGEAKNGDSSDKYYGGGGGGSALAAGGNAASPGQIHGSADSLYDGYRGSLGSGGGGAAEGSQHDRKGGKGGDGAILIYY